MTVWRAIDSDAFHDNPTFRHGLEDELANAAMFYEGVLLVGARPDDVAQWKGRGFRPDWERARVFIGHFEPCAVEVELDRGRLAPLLDVGVQTQPVLHDLARAAAEGPDGRIVQRIDWAPCGHVWIRPHWDGTASDGSATTTLCANAGPDGALPVFASKKRSVVRCLGGPDAP
jgi:hypothetical protein